MCCNKRASESSFEQITFNFAPSIRNEKLGGLDYVVAPASMLVEGVLNGSKGPLFYPASEITKNVEAWNMMPLTLGHPHDEAGNAVSARSPGVLEKFGLGFVFNARDFSGSLKAEAWFDVNRTRLLAPSVLNRLQNGSPIELSTGLYTDNFPVSNGTFNGRVYRAVARNHRPDHLAILVDSRGACSLDDGCGVGVTNSQRSKSVEAFQKCRVVKSKCRFNHA